MLRDFSFVQSAISDRELIKVKRSYAVLMIAESLVEPHFPDDVMKEADSILKRLEKAGLNPPRYTGLIANGKKYEKDIDFGRDVMMFNGWEPEEGD